VWIEVKNHQELQWFYTCSLQKGNLSDIQSFRLKFPLRKKWLGWPNLFAVCRSMPSLHSVWTSEFLNLVPRWWMALPEVTEPTFCMNGICCRHSAGLNREQPGMNDCFHMVMWSVCYCRILSLQLTTASLNYNSLQWLFGETAICFWLFDLVFQHFFLTWLSLGSNRPGWRGWPWQ
jgi:hypothetical protein